jgi:serine/threonine protein kinase
MREKKNEFAGEFAQVVLAKWRGANCVVKKMKSMDSDRDKISFEKEAERMKKIRPHPNLVGLIGVCLNPYCIVMEYVPGGR